VLSASGQWVYRSQLPHASLARDQKWSSFPGRGWAHEGRGAQFETVEARESEIASPTKWASISRPSPLGLWQESS
jgi:hypothetical protein